MAASVGYVLAQLQRWTDPGLAELSDAVLLERFVQQRDESAFAALVSRHGALVLLTCRRILGDVHEAEDAFQATFLVLARKAHALRQAGALPGFLHSVARRIALKTRNKVTCPIRDTPLAENCPDPRSDPLALLTARELLTALDEEIGCLPSAQRSAVLLCCLEGQTREEAAKLLGCTIGSLKGHLERGRRRLQERFRRRGIALSAALALVAVSRGAAIPPVLLRNTVTASLHGSVGSSVAALAHSALKGMVLNKLVGLAALGLTVVLVASAAVALVYRGADGVVGWVEERDPPRDPGGPTKEAHPTTDTSRKKDVLGDPLPPGAIARLGTIRLRHATFAFAFSPDGKRIASAGTDGLVRIWSTVTGEEVGRLDGHRGAAYAVAYSPDGKRIATGDLEDIHLWDAATGKKVRKMAGFDGGKDFKKRDAVHLLGIFSLAFSPDGKLLAAAEGDARISLWDTASGERRGQVEEGKGHFETLTFTADCQRLLASSGSVVQVWDANSKKLHKLDVGQRIRSVGLAALTDGKTVVAGSYRPITASDGMIRHVIRAEGTVSLWDIAASKERHRLEVPHPVLGVALSPDGKTVAYSQEQTVHLLDRDSWKESRRLELTEGFVFRLAFSPDGKVLAVAGRNDIQLWDVATGQPLFPRAAHSAEVDTIAFTANGKQLLSTCQETGVARLWDVEKARQIRTFAGDWRPLGVVVPSLDGKLLASSGTFNSMSIWYVATGKRVGHLQVEKKPPDKYAHDIRRLALSPDGKRLTSISNNNRIHDHGMTILVQETATGKELSRLKEAATGDKLRPDRDPTLSPDGQVMAETDGRTVRLRDVSTGKPWRILQADKLLPRETLSTPVVFSTDGRLLACLGPIRRRADGRVQESRIHVWELATGKEIASLAAPNTEVIAFAPDGRILATANRGHRDLPIRESAIHIWDVVGGAEVGRFQGHGTPVASLAFSPDGQRLATGLTDSTVLIWDLKPPLQRVRSAVPAVRAEDLPRLWTDLAGEEVRKAQASLWTLASDPSRALPYLEQQMTPARGVAPDRIRRLIADLESEQFAVRKSASEQLRQLDLLAEPALREALKGRPPLESRRRIEELLAEFQSPAATNERRQVVRAVAVLEYAKSEGARRLLRKLAAGAPEARLTREVRAALQRLQSRQRDGSP